MITLLIGYAVFAVPLQGFVIHESYPLFAWQLFSYIPNERTEYTIAVHQWGDSVYDPPLAFSELRFIAEAADSSPTEYIPDVQELGMAVEKGADERIDMYQQRVSHLFGNKPFRYDVRRVRIDPVEYWKTGTYKEEVLLGTFERKGQLE